MARKGKGSMTRRVAGMRNMRKAQLARVGRRGEVKKTTMLRRI